jgi:hypothetical protein
MKELGISESCSMKRYVGGMIMRVDDILVAASRLRKIEKSCSL